MKTRSLIAALLALALIALTGCGAKEAEKNAGPEGNGPDPAEPPAGKEGAPDARSPEPRRESEEEAERSPLIGGPAMIANPFTGYETLEAAEETAGFGISLPVDVPGADRTVYRVMDTADMKMLEVIYYSGDAEILRVRKAPGREKIDGDYNVYKEGILADYPFAAVEFRIEGGRARVIDWILNEDGTDYSYAVLSDQGLYCGMNGGSDGAGGSGTTEGTGDTDEADGTSINADSLICVLSGYERSVPDDPSGPDLPPTPALSSEPVLPDDIELAEKTSSPGITAGTFPGTFKDPEEPTQPTRPHSRRTVIVSVDEGFSEDQLSVLLEKYSLSVVYDYNSFRLYALSADHDLSDEELFALLDSLKSEDGVLGAEPDYIIELTDPVEPAKESI